MKDETTNVALKVKEMQDAYKRGELAAHAVGKSVDLADGEVASSWGPAMRR
jgi:hypothetical protein